MHDFHQEIFEKPKISLLTNFSHLEQNDPPPTPQTKLRPFLGLYKFMFEGKNRKFRQKNVKFDEKEFVVFKFPSCVLNTLFSIPTH